MSTQTNTVFANEALQNLSDDSLLRCFQGGDNKALGVLFRRYERPLVEFLFRMSGNREVAQDLTQDVFVRVMLHSQGFRGNAKVSTWLFAIAKNCCLSYLRHKKVVDRRIQQEGESEEGFSWMEKVASSAPSPERCAQTQQEFSQVVGAIRALNQEQQQVLVMREAFEYAHNEIAEKLSCPENTVKTRAFRALGHVRKALGIHKLAA